MESLLREAIPPPPASALVAPLPAASRTAKQICADAKSGPIATATATKVGAARSLIRGFGPNPHRVFPNALSAAASSAQAAWCWSSSGPEEWTNYLASEGMAPQESGTVSGQSEAPSGSPTVYLRG
jgi:hypothetical protein